MVLREPDRNSTGGRWTLSHFTFPDSSVFQPHSTTCSLSCNSLLHLCAFDYAGPSAWSGYLLCSPLAPSESQPSHYLTVLLLPTLLHILHYLGCHKAPSFFLPPCLDLACFFLFLSHHLPSYWCAKLFQIWLSITSSWKPSLISHSI